MQFYINEILLSDKPIIDIKFKPEQKSIYINFVFNLNMHNKSFVTLEPNNYSLAIHTSNRVKLQGENILSSTLTPDLKRINNLKQAP
ncbi:MAG: hypothetical protein COS08_01235, partial [Euryarchaeota archaeon CG01_land_8_20_14_3_00_38_12]